MSGHSKWSTIKRKKGAADAKRGALFTKLAKVITIAAREGGGGDPSFNFQLRSAIDAARAANMPKDNIDRAVKRGTGELDGGRIEEVLYEGFGPAGVAVMVQALTDNRNRTGANIKHIFTKNGGSIGGSGAVQWMFENKGVVRVEGDTMPSEDAQLALIDAGVDDIVLGDGEIVFSTAADAVAKVRDAAEDAGYTVISSQLEWVAKEEVEVADDAKAKIEAMFEALDDDEDANNIYTNAIL